MGGFDTVHLENLDVLDVTGFDSPDLTTFCRLDGLGLVVVGQHLEPKRVALACRVVEDDQWCAAGAAAKGRRVTA